MALKLSYDNKEDVPEEHLELFTEKEGKWVLTGVEGMKTQKDVDTVLEAHRKEKEDHKETKAKLRAFGDLDPEEAQTKLDKYDEMEARLEAGDGGQVDEEKMEKIVERRVRTATAPMERENKKLKDENAQLSGENTELSGSIVASSIEAQVRKHAEISKMIPSAIDDAVMLGERVLHMNDDNQVVTRDNVGVTPDVSVEVWMTDMQEKRGHWWPRSEGGNAPGADNSGPGGANNPWSPKHWNVTEQGKYAREQGTDKAKQMASAASSFLGATRPTEKK